MKTTLAALALAALALVETGCVMHANTLNGTRIRIEEQLPGASFDPEFQLTLGRLSLGLTRRLIRAVDEDEDLGVLWDINRVEVAIYRTESLPSMRQAGFVIPHEKRLKKKGWMTATRATSPDGATWVLFREKDGGIHEIMVGALDEDELVLVKLRGDIQGIFERLEDDGILDVPGVVHADLDPEPGEPIATVDDESG